MLGNPVWVRSILEFVVSWAPLLRGKKAIEIKWPDPGRVDGLRICITAVDCKLFKGLVSLQGATSVSGYFPEGVWYDGYEVCVFSMSPFDCPYYTM